MKKSLADTGREPRAGVIFLSVIFLILPGSFSSYIVRRFAADDGGRRGKRRRRGLGGAFRVWRSCCAPYARPLCVTAPHADKKGFQRAAGPLAAGGIVSPLPSPLRQPARRLSPGVRRARAPDARPCGIPKGRWPFVRRRHRLSPSHPSEALMRRFIAAINWDALLPWLYGLFCAAALGVVFMERHIGWFL